MKLEQINKIVEDYESLLRLIRNKADLLLIFDLEKYYGINYADDISIENSKVYLTDSYYLDSWNFPKNHDDIINKWDMAQDGDYIFDNKDIKYKRK